MLLTDVMDCSRPSSILEVDPEWSNNFRKIREFEEKSRKSENLDTTRRKMKSNLRKTKIRMHKKNENRMQKCLEEKMYEFEMFVNFEPLNIHPFALSIICVKK